MNTTAFQYRVVALLVAASLVAGCSNATSLIRPPANPLPSPVAYVTAAPLAQPTATATEPPLAAPTTPPPTVVPKRMPIASTSSIGQWSERLDAAKPYSGYLDLAVGTAGLILMQTNPALITLNTRQVSVGYSDVLSDVKANHSDWLLYDKKGAVAFSTANKTAPLIDIRNAEVISQVADDVGKLVTAPAFDGIILRNVGVDLIRKDFTPMYTGTKAFTDGQRRDAVEAFVKALRAKVPDKLMIIGGYAWKDGAAYEARTDDAQELGAIVDGVLIDEFLRSPVSTTTEFRSEAGWKSDVDYLSAVSKDNRIVLITTRLDAGSGPTDTVRQWLRYSVASYLLGKNGERTYFQFDPGSLVYAGDPEFSAPLGAPLEDYVKLTGGLYQRKFGNGIVLVNPSGEAKEAPLEGAYKTTSGNAASGKAQLGAHTGLILLNAPP